MIDSIPQGGKRIAESLDSGYPYAAFQFTREEMAVNPNQLHALQAMMVVMPIFILIAAIVMLVPWWFIYKKAGFSSWLCLLMIIPFINLVMLYVLAFTDWRVPPARSVPLRYQPPYYPPSALPPQG